MSERMTHVGPRDRTKIPHPTLGVGLEAYGRHDRPEMIRRLREFHQAYLEQAQAVLALTDDELIVTTYLGSYAQRGKTEVTE
jgi:hypothetical protein